MSSRKATASQLATASGDGGPYWEDGAGADAKNTAMDRNNQTRAVSAEELSTVSRYLNPTLAVPRQTLDRIWMNLMLYAEHTWDSWDSVYRPDSEESVGQLATKDQYVAESGQAANSLAQQSLSQIANQIHMPAGSLDGLQFAELAAQRACGTGSEQRNHCCGISRKNARAV